MLQRYTRYFHHFRIQWNIHCNLYILMVICIAYIIILFFLLLFTSSWMGLVNIHICIHTYTNIILISEYRLASYLLHFFCFILVKFQFIYFHRLENYQWYHQAISLFFDIPTYVYNLRILSFSLLILSFDFLEKI